MNTLGLLTLCRRELRRTFQIINQVVWPPIVSTLLYILIIGISVGGRIETTSGVPYVVFLIPGLVILTVIEASFAESSASLFQHRFMNSIQELLTAPLSAFEIVCGFVSGSVARALLLGNLLLLFLPLFTGRWPAHVMLYLGLMVLVAVLFSAIGLLMGLWAEKWDHIAIPQTFFFTPLIWLGGAFSPLSLLPEAARPLAAFNPMFYLIDGFRYAVLDVAEVPLWQSLGVTVALTALALGAVLELFRRGWKLRV
ncbi:MAG: ABC transporter permease [Candidatus Sericytochromatia bacterium]|nr:ABC transporter permease [Candidatus Sericytochromatia bacterium]